MQPPFDGPRRSDAWVRDAHFHSVQQIRDCTAPMTAAEIRQLQDAFGLNFLSDPLYVPEYDIAPLLRAYQRDAFRQHALYARVNDLLDDVWARTLTPATAHRGSVWFPPGTIEFEGVCVDGTVIRFHHLPEETPIPRMWYCEQNRFSGAYYCEQVGESTLRWTPPPVGRLALRGSTMHHALMSHTRAGDWWYRCWREWDLPLRPHNPTRLNRPRGYPDV